jgi:hypothetical protein
LTGERRTVEAVAEDKIEKSRCFCKLRNRGKIKEIDEDLHVS